MKQGQEWSEGDSEEECDPEYTEEYRPDDAGEEPEDEEDEGDRILDRFIIIAGVAVLLMALVTGIALVVFRMRSSSPEEIREVGAQLVGVDLIGGRGWMPCPTPSRFMLPRFRLWQRPNLWRHHSHRIMRSRNISRVSAYR